MSRFELRKTVTFEAAHHLPHVPSGHKCGRLHGHSFSLTLILRGPLHSQQGWLVDYADIKAAAKPFLDLVDHRYLNEIQGLENPTSEVIAQFAYDFLKPQLPDLAQIIVAETCTTECRYPA